MSDELYCIVDEKDRLTYAYSPRMGMAVGDIVELPPLPWMGGSSTWRGTVVALGREGYDGPCKRVIRRIPPDQVKAEQDQIEIDSRAGMAVHEHVVKWHVNWQYTNPRSPFEYITLALLCGCELTWSNLGTFTRDMAAQKGWEIRSMGVKDTPNGPDTDPRDMSYGLQVRRRTLG